MITTQEVTTNRLGITVLAWFGQLVSLIGSNLTSFALALWVYQYTDSITQLSFISFCAVFPTIALSPLAGTLIDRWDKRRVMIFGDIGVGVITLVIALLFLSNHIEIWHIYLATAISATFGTFQRLAYSATIPLMIPKQYLGRANGMVQLAQSVSPIFAPALAGVLLMTIKVQGVILIDFGTFIFAVATLSMIEIPKVKHRDEKEQSESLWNSLRHGLDYLAARPGLLGILFLFTIGNFLLSVINVLEIPLILSIVNSTVILDLVISINGIGGLVGSLVMSVWGGPKQQVLGVLGFMLMFGFCLIVAGIRPSLGLIMVGSFGFLFALPIVGGCSMVIWHSKIALDMLGRTTGLAAMVTGVATSLGYLLAGPLVDSLNQLLLPNNLLAGTIGQVIGVGVGRGIGLFYVVSGVVMIILAIAGYLYPHIRYLEVELPDATINEQPTSLPM